MKTTGDVSMEEQFAAMRKAFCDLHDPKMLSDAEWEKLAKNTVVALPVGGKSSRFQHIMKGDKNTNKAVFELPNGDSMLEMTLRLYRDAGIKRFVALIDSADDSVKQRIGDGSSLGIEVTYLPDPPGNAGRGGMIHNIIASGAVAPDQTIIVHNPDDLILEFADYPKYLISAHVENVARGHVATVSVFPTRDYPGSAIMVVDNEVRGVQYHPDIPIPIHTGITVLAPAVYEYFPKYLPLDQNTGFESTLYTVLTAEGKLGAADFPHGQWLPVNEDKFYNKLLEYIDTRK